MAGLLLITFLQLHLEPFAFDREAVHACDGRLRPGRRIVRHEAKTAWPAIAILLHPAAYYAPKVFEVLAEDRVVPAIRNVVDEQVCAHRASAHRPSGR